LTLPQVVSRNVAQRLASVAINTRTTTQPVTHYTCPTGQKAHIKGRVQCTGRGAASTADFIPAGTVMFRWSKTSAPGTSENYIDTPRALSTGNGGQFALFEFDLAAGETIVTDQDSGTNAEFNLWMEVTESPA